MENKKKRKPKTVTVTMKFNKDGSMTIRSTGGYDLRKLGLPIKEQVRDE